MYILILSDNYLFENKKRKTYLYNSLGFRISIIYESILDFFILYIE